MEWNMSLNGAGYCGIQDSGSLGRNYIIALWDPASGGGTSTAVYWDPSGTIVRSCGEGCGITYKNYNIPWQVNQWYRLVARAWDYQGQTYFALWSYDETGQVWTHHATFAFPIPGTRFDAGGGAIGSFLENFSTDDAQDVRRDNLNDGWGRSASSGWIPFSSAVFNYGTTTGPYANAYDAGVQNGAYYLQSGGDTTPTLSPGATLTLPFTVTAPSFPVGLIDSVTASYNLTANQITVSWVVDETASPQFTYEVDIFNNPEFTGSPIVSYSDTAPDVRSIVLTPPALGTTLYYARVSITDIFDQAAVPVSFPVFGTGVTAYVWPPSVTFGPAPVGATTSSQTVTVTNIGTANLTISTVTMGGTNASDFAKSGDICTGATVTPNGTCTVSVTFTPSTTGSRTASLNFTDNSNGVAGSTQSVSLVGTGSDPVPFIDQPLVPTSAAPGGPGFTLTVKGTGFTSGAKVNWNGAALATTFIDTEELKATVPAANIASPGTASVTVVNPGSALISNMGSFSVTPSTPTVTFSNASGSPIAVGTNPNAIAVGDFNGDGKLDLAVSNLNGANVTILLGNGDGTFTPAAASPATGVWPCSVAAGDFNGDGKLDLAVANQNSGNVTILLGNGDGTFTPAAASPWAGSAPISVAVGDFNADGKLDLAVANYGSNNVTILLGNGDGSFTPAFPTPATGAEPYSVAVGDFNGDGILDLAVANSDSNNVTILLGKGDGTFTPAASSPATGAEPSSVAVGDFNRDGKLDLAVTNRNDNNATVLLGNGDGTFTPAASSPPAGGDPFEVAVGDFNADGKLDLAVLNYESGVTILLGNGDGTFTPAASYQYAASGPFALAIGDFNGDGGLDLATANIEASSVSILLQLLPAPVVGVSPSSLTFSSQSVGTTSASQSVTLSNTGTATLTIISIAASANFGEANNCGGSVAASGSCTINVAFTPTTTGTRTGTLTITDNNNGVAGSTQTVTLSGTGFERVVHWPGPIVLPPRPPSHPVPGQPIRGLPPSPPVTEPISAPVPAVSLAPSSLTFSAQIVGTRSSAQTVTLANTGNGTLTLTAIATSADFGQTNNCGGSVAARGSCMIHVTFSPTATGSLAGTLTITDNSKGVAGSKRTVTLSGTGTNSFVR
jgi:hypothetical protein